MNVNEIAEINAERGFEVKPTYTELQDYLARQFCVGCPDQGPDGVGSGEGCEDCPVMDVPTEPYPDKET